MKTCIFQTSMAFVFTLSAVPAFAAQNATATDVYVPIVWVVDTSQAQNVDHKCINASANTIAKYLLTYVQNHHCQWADIVAKPAGSNGAQTNYRAKAVCPQHIAGPWNSVSEKNKNKSIAASKIRFFGAIRLDAQGCRGKKTEEAYTQLAKPNTPKGQKTEYTKVYVDGVSDTEN